MRAISVCDVMALLVLCLLWRSNAALVGRMRHQVLPLRNAYDQCINPNGQPGHCVPIHECAPILDILEQRWWIDYGFVRDSKCWPTALASLAGEVPQQQFVCCTRDSQFAELSSTTESRERHVKSIIFPDDERYLSTTAVPGSTTTSTPLITTTTPWTTTTTRTTTETPREPPAAISTTERETVVWSRSERPDGEELLGALPQPPHCGALTLSNKIYGGSETDLTEFSWLVMLEYLRPDGNVTSECAGSLINERYVLTAAHCITGEIETKVGQITSLRVGEHNTETTIDCIGAECLDAFQRFGIESVHVHENYQLHSADGVHSYNDIALIRLDRAVDFRGHVQPICLPRPGRGAELSAGMKLTVAGWGHTGRASHSATKQKVRVPLVERLECQVAFWRIARIAEEQLCAGGVFNEDSCSGDSGGPLMHLSNGAWFLEGIVSYGQKCGLEKPGVYTRVASYLEWIERNVRQ